MSTKTTTMTTEASAEYRLRVQGIGDNNEGRSGSKIVPVDNENGVLVFLSVKLLTVTLFFSVYLLSRFGFFYQISFFFFTAINSISTAIMWKNFTNCTLTLRLYPLHTGELKKLRVIIINKDIRKYLAHKKGNYIIIWSWNNSKNLALQTGS